ncbi:MAG: pilin [Deltaproteobacteria bacterium]|nr:pilin [Deltaproteobacteria bacterium]
MKNRKGFTLIELMIVVAIIGILAAIAIPMYRTQQIKAKMTEGTRAVSTVSSAIGDYYQDEETWPPACGSVAAINNTLGVGVSTTRYVSAMSTNASGVITVTFQNIANDVNGNSLTLTPSVNANGSIDWNWGSVGLPQKYVPKE